MIDRQTLQSESRGRAIRVVALILGVLTWLVHGVSILANFINPMSGVDFLLAIYFGVAGVLAIVHFFSKRLWQLVIALPGVIYLGGIGTLGLLFSVIHGASNAT